MVKVVSPPPRRRWVGLEAGAIVDGRRYDTESSDTSEVLSLVRRGCKREEGV